MNKKELAADIKNLTVSNFLALNFVDMDTIIPLFKIVFSYTMDDKDKAMYEKMEILKLSKLRWYDFHTDQFAYDCTLDPEKEKALIQTWNESISRLLLPKYKKLYGENSDEYEYAFYTGLLLKDTTVSDIKDIFKYIHLISYERALFQYQHPEGIQNNTKEDKLKTLETMVLMDDFLEDLDDDIRKIATLYKNYDPHQATSSYNEALLNSLHLVVDPTDKKRTFKQLIYIIYNAIVGDPHSKDNIKDNIDFTKIYDALVDLNSFELSVLVDLYEKTTILVPKANDAEKENHNHLHRCKLVEILYNNLNELTLKRLGGII